MSIKYKVGDWVLCINNNNSTLTIGKKYKVLSVLNETQNILIENDNGFEYYYTMNKFRHMLREDKLKRILNEI